MLCQLVASEQHSRVLLWGGEGEEEEAPEVMAAEQQLLEEVAAALVALMDSQGELEGRHGEGGRGHVVLGAGDGGREGLRGSMFVAGMAAAV